MLNAVLVEWEDDCCVPHWSIRSCIPTGLLELSQQYTEWALKKKVEHLIKKGLSTDKVAGLYGVATKFDAKVLEESCVKFAASHMTVVMKSDGFKKLPGDIAHTFVCKLSERDVYKT